MIVAVVGIPGAGKSFWAVKTAMDYIASGGCVFTNIRFRGLVDTAEKDEQGKILPSKDFFRFKLEEKSAVRKYLKRSLKWDYQEGQYSYIPLDEYDESFLSLIPQGQPEKRLLLILDEVNEWFDSIDRGKLSSNAKYKELFKFLRLSRHYYVDVVFLLQDFNTLNPRLRALCAKIIKCTDMQKMKIAGFPIPFPFPWLLWKDYDNKGKPTGDAQTWVKDQDIFACYDSFCEHGAVGLSGQLVKTSFESSSKKKGKKKMNIIERVVLYCVIGWLCFSLWRLNARVDKGLVVAQSAPLAVAVRPPVAMASAVASNLPPARPPVRPVEKRNNIFYGVFQYAEFGNEVICKIDGVRIMKGRMYSWGRCVALGEDFAQFSDELGNINFVYHRSVSFLDGKQEKPNYSLSVK